MDPQREIARKTFRNLTRRPRYVPSCSLLIPFPPLTCVKQIIELMMPCRLVQEVLISSPADSEVEVCTSHHIS